MEENAPGIANLVNSIIGVSVLAMPYCMKQCGLLLGLGLLLGASWLTYVSCSMLVTSAVIKRRRTYEYLAYHAVGPSGKLAVELSMIGLMLGTCVAFYVIIGDLATGILSNYVEASQVQLRTFVLVFCGLCIALPLGLMKNLSVLGFMGFFSMIFYCLFVLVMFITSVSNGLLTFDWLTKIELFRPAGIFQSLPIFSLAYACQCQLFVVYDSLEDASVMRMESIVSGALKIVTTVYCLVAVFGYTTFQDSVYGNVLQNLPHTFLLEAIKFGFAGSVVIGFPLMIFPCRQSIYTLFFKQPQSDGVPSKTYIEPFTFKVITLCIVLSTMTVAIFIPNVETILGLTGATMGSFICFIFPAIIYSKAYAKADAFITRFVFAVGCLLLIFCTYQNLTAQPEVVPEVAKQDSFNGHQAHDDTLNVDAPANVENPLPDLDKPPPSKAPIGEPVKNEHRHEPANPIEPVYIDHKPDTVDEKPEEVPKEEVKDSPKVNAENLQPNVAEKDKDPPAVKKEEIPSVKHNDEAGEKPNQVPAGAGELPVDQQEQVDNKDAKREEPSNSEDNVKKQDGDGDKKEEELLMQIKAQQEKQQEILQKQSDLLQALQEQHLKEHVESEDGKVESQDKPQGVDAPEKKQPPQDGENKKVEPVIPKVDAVKDPVKPVLAEEPKQNVKQVVGNSDVQNNIKVEKPKENPVEKEPVKREEVKQQLGKQEALEPEIKPVVQEPRKENVVEENKVVAKENDKLSKRNVDKNLADSEVVKIEPNMDDIPDDKKEDVNDKVDGEDMPKPRELKSYDEGKS
uniref:Putative sodium-coupled neutral amino acid transporter 10 n=1 Tax=Phallusia mammillata TaxID=59560 RepID=A0A6F9DTQ3_9ASCI|nr:putative sodium-coupled neutral amino acid transporter 10 [Phallusia mammillata]